MCTTASYIPQLRKCWNTGETGDLSLKMLLLLTCGLGLWIVYGLMTGAPGHAAAVLIRSAGPFSGPGRLARGLQVSGALNGVQAKPSAGLWFEDAPVATSFRIQAGPRIGVDYAGPISSRRKLRFVLRGA